MPDTNLTDTLVAALPSWAATPRRDALIRFLAAVTAPDSPDYQPPAARLAVFDHDGTLWCEKPRLIHLYAIWDRFTELAREHPRALTRRLWRALRTDDHTAFDDEGRLQRLLEPFVDVLGVPFSGMSEADYNAWVHAWLADWRHPHFAVPASGLVYRPMVELVRLLHDHAFTVAIATADEAAFVRQISQRFYGVPPELVLGTTFAAIPGADGRRPRRGYHPDVFGDGENKRISIAGDLQQRPILAVGNSDGDLPLLEWVAGGTEPSLALLVRHTDDEREYAYDHRARDVLAAAAAGGWPVVDMAADWRVVFRPHHDA